MLTRETYNEIKSLFNAMHDDLGLDMDKYEREDYFFNAVSLVEQGMSVNKAVTSTFEEYI